MTDLAVIILTKDEKLHIERCLERLAPLAPKQIFVVDCFSTDGTPDIAKKFGATVVEHEWPGLYAKQFNWALDNLPIEASWVLRLDADEYLVGATIDRLREQLPNADEMVSGFSLELGRTFWGRPVSRGVGRMWLTRVFRRGLGRCEDKMMDEHIVVSSGRIEKLKSGKFIDDNLNGPDWWIKKHLGYANREAGDAIAGFKKGQKGLYYKMPPYFRALIYFLIRYIVRGGFLEGVAGLQWHFFQGLWYRMLVDVKIGQIKKQGHPEIRMESLKGLMNK